MLLAGLQAIDWLGDLATAITALGNLSTLLLAGLFILTALWDLVTSGEQVTNTDTPAFPREGRILLYLGYTLIATSLLLGLGSLQAQTTGIPLPGSQLSDHTATLGLDTLGPSMVVLAFLLSMRRPIQQTAVVAVATQPTRRASPRIMQFGILGSGVLAIALITTFLLIGPVPSLLVQKAPISQAPYTAAIPGPGCDRGGATWTVFSDPTISTRCLSTGLQVTESPKALDWIEFSAPGAPGITDSQKYTVSVHVNLSKAPDSCATIATHLVFFAQNPTTFYISIICSDGHWGIGMVDESKSSPIWLAQDKVAQASAYTIEATTNGANQRLAIDGKEVASVSAVDLTNGSIALDLANSGTGKEVAVFSDFVFTPLP